MTVRSNPYFYHVVVYVVGEAYWSDIITHFSNQFSFYPSYSKWPRLLEQMGKRKACGTVLPGCAACNSVCLCLDCVLMLTCACPQKFLECSALEQGKNKQVTSWHVCNVADTIGRAREGRKRERKLRSFRLRFFASRVRSIVCATIHTTDMHQLA